MGVLQPSKTVLNCVADLSKSPVDYFSAGLVDDSNVFEWDVTIIGPSDTILCVSPCGLMFMDSCHCQCSC